MPKVPLLENMAQYIQMPAAPRTTWSLRDAPFPWRSAIIGILMGAVYYRVLTGLVKTWWVDPDFSHGFLVPIFAAYLLWVKRKTLRTERIAPVGGGVAVVAFGLLVLLLC